MVNGDLDLWQEGVCQFVGLPKNCPSLRYQSRAVPHKSLHLQHIITKESPNILFYTTAGKRDHKTHHGVIWLINCSSMFRLWVIFNSTFVCRRAVWYRVKTRHKSIKYTLQYSSQIIKLAKAWCWRTPQSRPLHTCGKSRLRALNEGGSSGAGAQIRLGSPHFALDF